MRFVAYLAAVLAAPICVLPLTVAGGLTATGPAPPAQCPPYPPQRTGKTVCWLPGTPIPIDCAGTGQDAEFQTGVSVANRFTDNGDGTVTDHLTALTWLQNASCFGDGTWREALQATNDLRDGDCGLTDGSLPGDWRLPNVRELHSLIDYGDHPIPALPPGHPFSGVQHAFYWSSTGSGDAAWGVNFGRGVVAEFPLEPYDFLVWPVRGGL